MRTIGPTAGKTVIFGFGRVGRMVADMLAEHGRAYLAVDSDIDGFADARKAGYSVLYGDVSRKELIEKLDLDKAVAVVLTMDDPVLTARIAKRLRDEHPALPIIARARDTDHAAALYRAGVTDAVPEALEASLQLSRGGAGRHRRGDGPGDRLDPRKAKPSSGPRSWRRGSWRWSRAWAPPIAGFRYSAGVKVSVPATNVRCSALSAG